MKTIRFSTDVPQDLALAHLDARPARTNGHNGRTMMFLTIDDRAFYVTREDAAAIERRLRDLGVQPGERILIAHESVYEHGEKPTRWNIYRASGIGQQADGTFIVPTPVGAVEPKPAPLPAKSEHSRLEHTGPVLYAREQAQIFVDLVAQTLDYATRCHAHLGLTREDAIGLVLAAYTRPR